MSIFKGAGVAIVTPFDSEGKVDYEAFADIIEDQIAAGTDAIIVCGTTGEASTLSHEEHIECIEFCCKQVNKRIPVVAGTGSNCTETAIYLSKAAEAAGADGVLLVSPYYNKATQNGLYEHFKRTAEAINIPCILYNVPSRTGCNIQPATVVRLAKDVKNIVAIKEASGDISQIATLLSMADGCIDVYSGNDDQIVPIMSLGGIGVISVLSNVAPEYTHEICQSYLDGDVKKAAKMQLDAIPLIKALFCEVNPIPVKAGMNMLGYKAGSLRLPLTEMEDAHKAVLKQELVNMGII
ncbi:MAG: 4-hydroxy-tetrahydrodipicolinate synthase [Lachnospiraceae bacterium]|nr:4-hydroxy-tetrahydrodipicolinate synthase [Lachnospiraceae bacterium]